MTTPTTRPARIADRSENVVRRDAVARRPRVIDHGPQDRQTLDLVGADVRRPWHATQQLGGFAAEPLEDVEIVAEQATRLPNRAMAEPGGVERPGLPTRAAAFLPV